MQTLLKPLITSLLLALGTQALNASESFELIGKTWTPEPRSAELRASLAQKGITVRGTMEYVPEGFRGDTTQFLIQIRNPDFDAGSTAVEAHTTLQTPLIYPEVSIPVVYMVETTALGALVKEYIVRYPGAEEYLLTHTTRERTVQFTVFKRGGIFNHGSERFTENRTKWKDQFLPWAAEK